MDRTLPVSILLVDDEVAQLDLVGAILRGRGYRLVRAGSGSEALRRVEKEDFALILMDVMMTGMDGFQTAAAIATREDSRHTPIIFLTAHLDLPPEVQAGYEVGAVDYIVKPVNAHILRAKVAVFAKLFELQEALRLNNAALEAANRELQRAFVQLEVRDKRLRICAKCKKIHDEAGAWVPLEEYFHAHLMADFTHGLCEECDAETPMRSAV